MGSVTAYILRRLGQSVVVLFGVTLIVFLLVHMLPGGPAKAMLGPTATLQQVRYFTVENGWNLPVLEQYVHYMGRLFQGNLGFSYTYSALTFDLRYFATTLSKQNCNLITGTAPVGLGSNDCTPAIIGTLSWNADLSGVK